MPNGKTNGREKSAFERFGCEISSWVSDVAANPFAQLGVVVVCVAWFAVGLNTNVLTAVLSILAISLTQMVLNRQNEREAEAHRRDVAMHAKLDELVIASKAARNEMAGIEEELDEEEIAELKQEAKEARRPRRS
jgi:low affinity Fe/Cu permease